MLATRYFSPFALGALLLGIVLFVSFHSPSNAYMQIHDFLDHLMVIQKLRSQATQSLDFQTSIPGVLNGVPLNTFNLNDFAIENIMYEIFNPFLAVALNESFSRFLSYVGFYLLFTEITSKSRADQVIASLGAFTFATLPYWPSVSSTIATIPLSLLLMRRLSKDRYDAATFLLTVYITQNANFTYGGFFYLIALTIYLVYRVINGSHKWKLTVVYATMILGILIANIRILYSLIIQNFESHRLEWERPGNTWFSIQVFPDFVREFLVISLKGQYHFASGQTGIFNLPSVQIVIIILSIIVSIKIIHRNRGAEQIVDKDDRTLVLFSTAILCWMTICIFYAAEISGTTQFQYLGSVPFQFNRVIFLVPFLFCLLFGLGLKILSGYVAPNKKKFALGLVIILIHLQVGYSYVPFSSQIKNLIKLGETEPTMSEYFMESDYSKAAKMIGKNPEDISVLSYGLDPMVASYNGFRALDGYSYNYSLEYKHQFYKIIAESLESNPSTQKYFLGWGSRVYLFPTKSVTAFNKFNWCQATKMGGEFLLSSQLINDESELKYIGKAGGILIYELPKCSY